MSSRLFALIRGKSIANNTNGTNRLRFIVLTAVCALYISLRFWHLADSCLWFDEIFSVHAAEHPWSELFTFVAKDLIHPPLFYVVLKLWIATGGESLLWLRSLPVFFSIAALAPFFLFCRQLKLRTLAVSLALLFLAVNGSLIKYAQEVRMYSLLMCMSLFSLWLFARFLNVGKGIRFLTLVNILLVNTHYFGWFIVFAEILAVLYLQRIKIGQTLKMLGLTVAGSAPWLIAIVKMARVNSDVSQNLGWAARPDPTVLFRFTMNLIEPFYYQASNRDATSIWLVTVPLLLIILAAAGFSLVGLRKQNEKGRNVVGFLVIMIFAPILLGFISSWILPFSIWGARHLVIIFAPAAILFAKFLGAYEFRKLNTIAIALIVCPFGLGLIGNVQRGRQAFVWCAWEELAATVPIGTAAEPVRILVFDDLIAYHFWFALRNEKNVQIAKINDIPEMSEDKAYFLPRGFNEVSNVDAAAISGDKFYIAFYAADFDYTKSPLRFFIEKGYRIGDPQIVSAQGMEAFLVEVKR